ncbi:hypothetical protein ABMZ15_06885, partial [Escherichia coli]
ALALMTPVEYILKENKNCNMWWTHTPISAQLGFALGYYCQWRSKNRSHRKKWGDWVTCLSLAILALGPLFNYLQ